MERREGGLFKGRSWQGGRHNVKNAVACVCVFLCVTDRKREREPGLKILRQTQVTEEGDG